MAMHSVTRATTVARLMYAVPSWWGLTAEKGRAKIERLYNGLKRTGYLPVDAPGIPALLTRQKLVSSNHSTRILQMFFTNSTLCVRPPPYRPHNYVLPSRTTKTLYLATCKIGRAH